MKQRLWENKRIWALLLAAIFVVASVALQAQVNHRATQNTDITARMNTDRIAQDFTKPDTEYLDFYGLGEFKTRLPVVYIDYDPHTTIKKNTKTWATLFVGNEKQETGYSVMQTPQQEETITINHRGASSYSGFEKKQFRIKFYDNKTSAKSKDVAFLGLGASSEWVLNGPYLDKTLMRNKLMYDVSREAMDWAPASRYCELFLNGEYQGVYLLVEPVTADPSRLNLTEYSLVSGQCAFIVDRNRVDSSDTPIQTYGKLNGFTTNDLFVSYPTDRNLTAEQLSYINNRISAFEEALYSDYFADPTMGYQRFIDVDSFATYVVLNEFALNRDAGNLSTYCYQDIEGKMRMANWDYNNAFDMYRWYSMDVQRFYMTEPEVSWFARLLQDRTFVDKVVSNYRTLRKSVLETSSLMERLDGYEKYLRRAIDRNYTVWGYSLYENMLVDDADAQQGRDLTSHKKALEQLKETITARLEFMDEHIEDLYDNCIN